MTLTDEIENIMSKAVMVWPEDNRFMEEVGDSICDQTAAAIREKFPDIDITSDTIKKCYTVNIAVEYDKDGKYQSASAKFSRTFHAELEPVKLTDELMETLGLKTEKAL